MNHLKSTSELVIGGFPQLVNVPVNNARNEQFGLGKPLAFRYFCNLPFFEKAGGTLFCGIERNERILWHYLT